jgi:AAA domain/Bifunctional DNA primase/polymerase, N-terminal
VSTSVPDQTEIAVTSPNYNMQALERSPYAKAGARLIDNGYSAIPIAPGSKRPGQYDMKAWRNAGQWQRYCDRLPTSIEIEIWNDWPDAGVCVPLNQQLKAIDIDTDDPVLIQAVLAVLPDSEVKKRGNKGFTAFYRGSPTIASKPFSIGKNRVLDLLAHGRQTVVPPTVHPDTGQPYHWLGSETLETVAIDALPLLPDNIAELLAEALIPFGYEPQGEHHRLVAGEGETYWREVNDTALKNLSAWVPDLRMKGTKKHGKGYRLVAEWRGVEDANVSIHPEGIKDWGNHESHTPIDLVMLATGSDLNSATNFLAERLQIRPHLVNDDFDVGALIERKTNTAANTGGSVVSFTTVAAANDNDPYDLLKFTSSRFNSNPPDIKYLVDRSIEHGIPGIIPAMGDTGKSFLMLELCRRVGFGESKLAPPIFGGPVVREGSAVFITAEDNEATIHRRICALDPKAVRLAAKGERLIIVPLPNNGGARAFWKADRNGLAVTDNFKRFSEALHKLKDVQLICIDPLASFSHAPINEDPAAGQFVCTSLANLAADLDATVLTAHHMRKPAKGLTIKTLGDAREAIRGTTALVDGMRLGYALWPVEEDESRRICRELNVAFSPNSVVRGGVVKANGPVSRMIATYLRDKTGLLIDCSSRLRFCAPKQYELISLLRVAIADAAEDGQPFTKTGLSGLYTRRSRMPVELRLPRARLENMAEELLDKGEIVACLAPKSTTTKWLDVPGGRFADGRGDFRQGSQTIKRMEAA